MIAIAEVSITMCDPRNPRAGYQIKIVDAAGAVELCTSRDPVDSRDLLTLDDALRVAGYYAE